MGIAHFNSSWYLPRRDRRAAWCGVIVVVLVVVIGFAAGYGEAVAGALVTVAASVTASELIKINLRNRPRSA